MIIQISTCKTDDKNFLWIYKFTQLPTVTSSQSHFLPQTPTPFLKICLMQKTAKHWTPWCTFQWILCRAYAILCRNCAQVPLHLDNTWMILNIFEFPNMLCCLTHQHPCKLYHLFGYESNDGTFLCCCLTPSYWFNQTLRNSTDRSQLIVLAVNVSSKLHRAAFSQHGTNQRLILIMRDASEALLSALYITGCSYT